MDISTLGVAKTFKDFMLGLQDLQAANKFPPELGLQPMVVNHPQTGRLLGIGFVWSSDDHEEGRKHLDTIISTIPSPVQMNTVAAISTPDWINVTGSIIPKTVWGRPETVSFRRLSPKALDIVGKALEEMPADLGTCLVFHHFSKQSPSAMEASLAEGSCFCPDARRHEHMVIEIIGSSISREGMAQSERWAAELRDALVTSGEVMDSAYLPLVGAGGPSLDKIYGEKWKLLKNLKRQLDPEGVFKYTVPRLVD
jgi:hypothetical protein